MFCANVHTEFYLITHENFLQINFVGDTKIGIFAENKISVIVSKFQKLVDRLLTKPKDFKYDEAKTILLHLGFTEVSKGKTSGSRVEFVMADKSILMHKPHPSGILKQYQVAQLTDFLIGLGLI